MQTAHLSLAATLPWSDPFAGSLVWGSTGLLIWLCCAALIGIGLHALRRLPTTDEPAKTEAPCGEDWRDAA